VIWTALPSPGTLLDHLASLIVSEHQIQEALGLGSATPTSAQLQEYFASQAPDFAGWTVFAPSVTHQHIETVADGQVYYFALTAVDNLGSYIGTFTFAPYFYTQNLLRYRTRGPVPTQAVTWGAMKAKWR